MNTVFRTTEANAAHSAHQFHSVLEENMVYCYSQCILQCRIRYTPPAATKCHVSYGMSIRSSMAVRNSMSVCCGFLSRVNFRDGNDEAVTIIRVVGPDVSELQPRIVQKLGKVVFCPFHCRKPVMVLVTASTVLSQKQVTNMVIIARSMLDCFQPAPTCGMITSSTMTIESGAIALAI